ncbi:amidase signature domain-containing protein [Chaetomium tenue]|uniref:Amidase signature domain-containing protein n=1 Tax=Chaetomium tenue TaxID=1854479 RepID=A0ACB7NX92_9PEZI|nr:amidase signature domain-containing protein [Chaetomium globosum]
MSITKINVVVDLGGISYHVGTRVEWALPVGYNTGSNIIPAVAFSARGLVWTVDGLRSVLAAFDRADDVFQPAFAKGALLIVRSDGFDTSTPTVDESFNQFIREKSSALLFVAAQVNDLPDGPYFVRGHGLHRAWRLYPDDNLAFTLALSPSFEDNEDPKWEPLKAAAYSGLCPVVAVPSRLYYPPSKEKPLNGLRITVKDNYHLAGVHTTMGSRSYTKLYGPQTQTSEFVKHLVHQGAVILGKTKLGGYAGSEVPPEKCIDYFPPWNPRGDGYQGPSGSSSGAGASVASYPWVDVALGTDTTGSIRMPAASYGLWGLPTTQSRFPREGIMPSVPAFDTIGLLARSPHTLRKIIQFDPASTSDRRLGDKGPSATVFNKTCKRPANIIVPTEWFPMKNKAQQKMVSQFLGTVEQTLGCNVLRLSFEDLWSETGPGHLTSKTLQMYLSRTKSTYGPNYYDGYHTYNKFRDDFQEKFGYPPYASPFMTRRWGLATNIIQEHRDQCLDDLGVYYDWVLDNILKPDTEYNFVLLPLGRPGANYRDIVPESGSEFFASLDDPGDFCTVFSLPQLVIPIGQNPYHSRVSGRTEYAPIVASLAGPQGSDEALLELAVEALSAAHWPLEVLTGRTAFEPAEDNDRHVAPSRDQEVVGAL